ncbi:MAG TPA: peptidylprolyl isomerase [Candidatus Nanoarchaeia archaeon]|nr:peptidylprolyl isomerase [Candidatus Nanoarchaeia archaeon]
MAIEVRASHILVKTEEEADSILKELQNKVSFQELARKLSMCPSKKQGGDLGWFERGMMVPEFEKAAFSAKINSPVKVKTQFGWHVILVTEQD